MKHLLFLLFFLTCYSGNSQDRIAPLWLKTAGSTIGGNAEGWGIAVDATGDVYWPYNIDNNGEALDIICQKYDPDGNERWSTPLHFGGPCTQQITLQLINTGLYFVQIFDGQNRHVRSLVNHPK